MKTNNTAPIQSDELADIRPDIVQAVAQGWCAPECSDIEMDSRLALAICRNVQAILAAPFPEQQASSGAEPNALRASIAELDEFLDSTCGEVLTPSQGESIGLVLHELKRLMAAPAAQEQAKPTEVKIRTWQERTGNHNWRPGSVKHALAEIAELREALAAAAPTPPAASEMTDAEIETIAREVGERFVSVGNVSLLGATAFARAIERHLSGNTTAKGE